MYIASSAGLGDRFPSVVPSSDYPLLFPRRFAHGRRVGFYGFGQAPDDTDRAGNARPRYIGPPVVLPIPLVHGGPPANAPAYGWRGNRPPGFLAHATERAQARHTGPIPVDRRVPFGRGRSVPVPILLPARRRARGVGAVDCGADPTSPDCVGGVYVGYQPTFYQAAATAYQAGQPLTIEQQRAAAQVLNLPTYTVDWSKVQNPYIAPPPQPPAAFIMTTAAGMQSPTQAPTLATYLNDAAYSAMNISNPAAGGNLQTAVDSVTQAAAAYRAIYPDAPFSNDIVSSVLTLVHNYYGGLPYGGGGGAAPATSVVPGGGVAPGSATPRLTEHGGGSPSGAANLPVTVTLENVSRPGQSLQVGDSFQLTVTGSPNSPVSGTATQDGRLLGTTPYGTTDANGQRVITGTMAPEHIGQWREMWTVGTAAAPVLSFTVSPASGGGASGGGGSSSAPGGGGGGGAAAGDFFSSSFSIFGVQIPVWAAGVGAIGLVWAMSSKR